MTSPRGTPHAGFTTAHRANDGPTAPADFAGAGAGPTDDSDLLRLRLP